MIRNRNTLFLILFSVLLFGFEPGNAAEEELLVLTEELPPFNYQEGGAVKGFATEIVAKLLGEAKLTYKIELVPWSRAYKTALKRPNTLIYTMAKTEARKDKFHWVGKISNRRLSLFRLRSRQDLANMTLEEAKEKAKIAVIRGDASTEKLLEMGFPEKNMTKMRDTGHNLCVKHVMGGRSDFFSLNPYSLKYRIRSGIYPDVFTEQFVIHDGDGYYIAASLGTDPSVLKSLRDAHKRLVKSGFVDSIVSDYLTF